MNSASSQHKKAQTWKTPRQRFCCRSTQRSRLWGLFTVAVACITTAVLCLPAVTGQVQTTVDVRREYNVKAVNIYGFCRFVTWPDRAFSSAKAELVIGIFGNSPIESPLRAIAAKKLVQNRRLKIVPCTTAEDAAGCHLVFVGRDIPSDQQQELIQGTGTRPVLLVGENSGFASAGGAVNFYISNGKVRFELNSKAAQAHRLKFDAKLLSLGTEIRNTHSSGHHSLR